MSIGERFREHSEDERQDTQKFYNACLDHDLNSAVSIVEQGRVPPHMIRHGLQKFLGKRVYDGLDPLFQKAEVSSDPGFVSEVVGLGWSPEDQLARVRLLNNYGVTYTGGDFCKLCVKVFGEDNPAALEVLKNGKFDVRENHSMAIMHAALSHQHGVFDELMKRGANLADALAQVEHDPRYEDGCATLREWATEFYKKGAKPEPSIP